MKTPNMDPTVLSYICWNGLTFHKQIFFQQMLIPMDFQIKVSWYFLFWHNPFYIGVVGMALRPTRVKSPIWVLPRLGWREFCILRWGAMWDAHKKYMLFTMFILRQKQLEFIIIRSKFTTKKHEYSFNHIYMKLKVIKICRHVRATNNRQLISFCFPQKGPTCQNVTKKSGDAANSGRW